MSSTVQYEVRGGVAYVTMAWCETNNALNDVFVDAISKAIRDANADPSCRAIVLRSSCSEFSRGMDFGAVLSGKLDLQYVRRAYSNCLKTIHGSERPVIACVEGAATGGGVGLSAACDVVIATEDSTFTLPETIIGMIPAMLTPFLLRRITIGRLQYMAISTRSLSAVEARSFGLVDEVATVGMRETLNSQLRRIFCSSPRAILEVKRYFDLFNEADLQRQLEIAHVQLEAWLAQPDVIEGLRSFAEGFAPSWFQKYKEVGDGCQDSRHAK